MNKSFRVLVLVFIAIISITDVAAEYIFGNSFEDFSAPSDAKDVARFLTQSTYGPTPQSINDFGSIDYAQWIDEQISLPATTHRNVLESLVLEVGPSGFTNQDDRVGLWSRIANTADDQLRQRMAFALSQIFVISEEETHNAIRVTMMAEFYDTLVRGAFGNYRDLLEDVTLSPSWLFI